MITKRMAIPRVAIGILVLGLVTGTLGAANPNQKHEEPFAAAASYSASGEQLVVQQRSTGKDEVCEQARKINKSPGLCSLESTLSVSEAKPVDIAKLTTEELALKTDTGVTLGASIAAGAVPYYKEWTQEMRGLYYYNWVEKHSGKVFYDMIRAWSTTSRNGYLGNHICDRGSGIGYSVSVSQCSTETVNLNSFVKEWDFFKVHVVAKGIPIYRSYDMHTIFYGNGTVFQYHSN